MLCTMLRLPINQIINLLENPNLYNKNILIKTFKDVFGVVVTSIKSPRGTCVYLIDMFSIKLIGIYYIIGKSNPDWILCSNIFNSGNIQIDYVWDEPECFSLNSFKAFDILNGESLYSPIETTYKDYITVLIKICETEFFLRSALSLYCEDINITNRLSKRHIEISDQINKHLSNYKGVIGA